MCAFHMHGAIYFLGAPTDMGFVLRHHRGISVADIHFAHDPTERLGSLDLLTSEVFARTPVYAVLALRATTQDPHKR